MGISVGRAPPPVDELELVEALAPPKPPELAEALSDVEALALTETLAPLAPPMPDADEDELATVLALL